MSASLSDVREELARRRTVSNDNSVRPASLSDVQSELSKRRNASESQAQVPSFSENLGSGLKETGKMLGRAALSPLDIPYGLTELATLGNAEKIFGKPLSHIVRGKLQEYGVNLEPEQSTVETPEQRIFMQGVEAGISTLLGGGIGAAAKGIPVAGKAAKVLLGAPSTAKEAASMSALGAATGTAAQSLHEAGMESFPAGITAAVGVPLGAALGKTAISGAKNIGRTAIAPLVPGLRGKAAEVEAARFLQNKIGKENLPEVVKRLEEFHTEIPDYVPPTSEVAQNVGLSQYQRAIAGTSPRLGETQQRNIEALSSSLENMSPSQRNALSAIEQAEKEHSALENARQESVLSAEESRSKALKEFESQVPATEAGESIRENLEKKVKSIREEAQEKVNPLYEKGYRSNPSVLPKNAQEYISSESKKWSGNIKKDLIEISSDIFPKISKEDKRLLKMREEALSLSKNPHDISKIEKTFPVPRGLEVNTEKLRNVQNDIRAKIESLQPTERRRKMVLNKVIKEIDVDLEHIPEIKEANSIYKEMMGPVNIIEEHPVLGKFLKDNPGYIKYALVDSDQIPNRVISGARSEEASKALWHEIKGNPELRNINESYINSLLMKEIVDSNDNVNLSKIDAFRKNYKGAFNIYPHLDTKLKNAQNAQVFVNNVIKKNKELESNTYNSLLKEVIGYKSDPNKLIGSILNSGKPTDKMNNLLKIASTDTTGAALEGIRRSTIEHIKSINTKNLTYYRFNRDITNNRSVYEKLFSPEQMSVLDSINRALERKDIVSRQGLAPGSPTAANLQNLAEATAVGAAKKLVGKLTGIGKDAIQFIFDPKRDILEEALLDRNKAKILLTNPVKDHDSFLKTIKGFKPKSLYLLPKSVVPQKEENHE